MQKILIADDEKEIVRLLKIYLEADNYKVYEANDGEKAFEIIINNDIDLAIVDIMMPVCDGYELIKKIRDGRYIPVLVISAKTQLSDRILGINIGADDYISKPFEPLEVAAKVRAHLRRISAQQSDVRRSSSDRSDEKIILCCGELKLDCDECVIRKNGTETELTNAEYKVLELFMRHPGRVFTKEQIYECAWYSESAADDNAIRVIISRLRNKIGSDYIKTIRGLGYRMERHEKT